MLDDKSIFTAAFCESKKQTACTPGRESENVNQDALKSLELVPKIDETLWNATEETLPLSIWLAVAACLSFFLSKVWKKKIEDAVCFQI